MGLSMCVCFIVGQGSVQVKNVADAMLDAVIDVLSQNSSSTLNTIRIVIFQPKMLKEFYHSMQQREATDAKATSWFGKLKGKHWEKNNFVFMLRILFACKQIILM